MTLTFEEKLSRYADLLVHVGLNVQPGQQVSVRAPIQTAPLTRLVVASAYKAGARYVDVMWSDDAVTLARFQHAPRDSFEEFPKWRVDGMLTAAKRGDAFLAIKANDPDLLAEQDPTLIATATKTANQYSRPVASYIMRDAVNWNVASAPIPSWAKKVFPDLDETAAVAALWDAIFSICRIDQPDPVAVWKAHAKKLVAVSKYLNDKQYDKLKYTGPGTALTLGLPQGHIWKGAQSVNEAGTVFSANLPTEEVFTLPHKDRIDGVVRATKPLNYNGTLIDDFSITFENGKVVKAQATKGNDVLQNLIASDPGAARLGEVALVPDSSPISQSGLLFYNTLFDENAASHLALGRAYRFTLDGGKAMTDDEFSAAGGNDSLVHVDFMVGSAQLDVDGITADGQTEPLMRQGEWAFEL